MGAETPANSNTEEQLKNKKMIDNHLEDQELSQDEIKNITANIQKEDFCENFADILKQNEQKIIDAITQCLDKDIGIDVLTDLLASLNQKSSDEYGNLKQTIQDKIANEKKKISENTTNNTFPNPDIVADLQKQTDQAYTALDDTKQDKGIEKNTTEIVTDYLRNNKDNQTLIALVNSLNETTGIFVVSAGDWAINKNIWTAEDFAKKVESMGLPKLDLKPKEKTVDNPVATTPVDNNNKWNTNTLPTKSSSPIEVNTLTNSPEGFKKIMENFKDQIMDPAEYPKSKEAMKNHPNFWELMKSIENIKTNKDCLYSMKITFGILKDILIQPTVQEEIKKYFETKGIKDMDTKKLQEGINIIAYNIDTIYEKTKNLSPEDFDKCMKDWTLADKINKNSYVTVDDYKNDLQAIDTSKIENKQLKDKVDNLLLAIEDATDQNNINKIVEDFIKDCDNTPKIAKDINRNTLKTDLKAKINIPKEDIKDLVEVMKYTKQQVETFDKEKSQDELSTYLNIMPSKEDDINKMADWLFETNEARFNALFDKDFRDTLTPSQQANLTKYIQTYLPDAKDITFDKINFVKTTKDKVINGDKTQRQSDKYPVWTNMIRIDGNTKTEIVFGTQDQAQTRISEAYIEKNPGKIKELGDQIANGENNEYIVNELNEKWSYITLAKIIENKPEVISKLLSNGFIESLMKSWNKLEEANKKISAENLKPENTKNQKPLLNEAGLKSILDQQRDGYLNVINNAVLNIMKQPNITVSSPERGMFQTYMQSCNKDPRALGATVDQRIASWNNVATRYKGFQEKNKLFFTDVIGSSLPDIANRPNNTELALHKAINNDFNALWIHIKGEWNEKYGLKAQMKSLFESFKDEILMIAEFLGFDKEKIMHRCGFNKELKDEMTKFFKEKYGLTWDQLNDIDKLSTGNPTLLENIKNVATNGSTKPGEVTPFKDNKDAITAFRNSKDIRKTYLESLKTVTPSGDFIKTLISQYNATQKNENDHIQYLDYVTKVNKNGKDAFEPTKGKREDLIQNHGEKLRNLDFVWDNIAWASANLEAMASPDRTGKWSESKTPEMAGMVLDKVKDTYGSNTNEDRLVWVSYYLSSMVIGGHDKLEYTISENNDKQPTATSATEAPKPAETPKDKLSIKDATLATEENGVYTITDKIGQTQIHEIFADFGKAPELIIVHDKETKKDITATKGKENNIDTYIDVDTGKRVKISAWDTIKEASKDQVEAYGEKKVTDIIGKVGPLDKSKLDDTQYQEQVTKPIFNLFTAKSTYDYMHNNDKENATIADATTLNKLMSYSYDKFKPEGSTTPFELLSIEKAIIKKKDESVDNKITFEVTEKGMTKPRVFTIDNTGKFEEIKKDQTPEKAPTTVDYTSIDAFRKSLGYTTEAPKDYDKKLETEFLKDGLTTQQQGTVAKEIARVKIKLNNDIQANNGNTFDFKTMQVNAALRDGVVMNNWKLKWDARKVDDTKIMIQINWGKVDPFKVESTITELLT